MTMNAVVVVAKEVATCGNEICRLCPWDEKII